MSGRWVAVCRAGTAGRGLLPYAGLRRRLGPGWTLRQPPDVLLLVPAASARQLHLGRLLADKELHKPSSKVEEAVESLRDQLKDAAETPPQPPPPTPPPQPPAPERVPPLPEQKKAPETVLVKETVTEPALREPPRRSLWIRFVDEVKHYYHGFKLLFININISRKLIWRVLNGASLSRRENRQLVRTVGDLFRVLPFSVFIIIPFMELLLPVFIKLFPNMLPSTFQTANAADAKMKQVLKVKLETAKFLQKTLDSMALKGKGHYSDSAREFADFFKEIRTSGEQASNEQILKFSKLFEDEVTLDSLDRSQLAALCRVVEVPPFGTNNFLRFLIQMKLRGLKADDRIIQRESVDTLTVEELQAACRARGMRAYGVSEQRLRSQLSQWLDLSLNEKVPPSLLLLSRALYLPENLPTSDQLKATISRLPDAVGTATRAAIGDREGRVDFKTRVDVVKDEERKILEERVEAAALAEAAAQEKLQAEAAAQEKLQAEAAAQELLVEAAPAPLDKAEPLRDPAAVLVDRAAPLAEKSPPEGELTSRDVSEIEGALETLAATRRRPLLEHEELEDIKEEMADYQEDLQDLRNIMHKAGKDMTDLKETRAARGLQYSVNRMINSLDSMIDKLQAKEKKLQLAQTNSFDAKRSVEEVGIQELIQTLQHIQSVPDKTKLNTIAHVLSKMDDNQDGSIRVEDVYDICPQTMQRLREQLLDVYGLGYRETWREVIELMGQDNLKLSSKQMEEIIELLDREKVLDLERRIEKALQKEAEDIAAAAAAAVEAAAQQELKQEKKQ